MSESSRPSQLPERAVVDRFENGHAVLIVDGMQQTVDRARLPPEAREGDVVDLVAGCVDREATEALRQRLTRARSALPTKAGDFDL